VWARTDPNGPVLFNARVGWALTKTVWAKEALGPPSMAQAAEAQRQLATGITTLRTMRFLDWTVQETARKALAGFHVVAFFVVGEMVGRWSIVGYKV
jgi:F-type H+-transporting ATPase subunit g